MSSAAKYFINQFSEKGLKEVYANHIAKTTAIGLDRISRASFEKDLKQQIEIIRRKVKRGTYQFTQYKEKLISKGACKLPRVISIPTYRDRLVLRALCNVLQKSFSEKISQRIPQVVISDIKASLGTGEFSHFIKVDVENFYPSIDHAILVQKLRAKVRKPEIIQLVLNGITNPTLPLPNKNKKSEIKGVPQGLATSNILAEIYLKDFDSILQAKSDIAYFRYVDDILVLSKGEPDPVFEGLKRRLNDQYRLNAHPLLKGESKSRVGKILEPFSFLGYEFVNGKASVKRESLERLENSLASIFTTYKYKVAEERLSALDEHTRRQRIQFCKTVLMWRLNLRITGCIFDGARKGWIFYFSQIDKENIKQLWKLDKTVRQLFHRFGLAYDSREVKSFVGTYFEARRKNPTATGYIPNFDTSNDTQKRIILTDYFGVANVDNLSELAVSRLFDAKIRRATQELENDIQGVS
ncbi:MAG: RNA-dependent DNA polymerase [Burkholderiales bacterium]|nr:RNA-dependent DNA polymerase [Burkholderiales bacterium]